MSKNPHPETLEIGGRIRRAMQKKGTKANVLRAIASAMKHGQQEAYFKFGVNGRVSITGVDFRYSFAGLSEALLREMEDVKVILYKPSIQYCWFPGMTWDFSWDLEGRRVNWDLIEPRFKFCNFEGADLIDLGEATDTNQFWFDSCVLSHARIRGKTAAFHLANCSIQGLDVDVEQARIRMNGCSGRLKNGQIRGECL